MNIYGFHSIRPPFESTQEDSLNWFVEAHVAAERGDEEFRKKIKERIWHCSCKPDKIHRRGHVLADFLHTNWEKMEIYKLDVHPQGSHLGERLKHFCYHADRILEQFYEGLTTPPDDLIHVSCTGYASPSAAQKLVSKKKWGVQTTVTHAYHMGCYGSIPALRMAKGFLASEPEKQSVDIVHTEICSLQANPLLHQTDQLVSQSLFADGFIKYTLANKGIGDHFQILKTKEEIIPDSSYAMTWNVVNWGFEMFLAKELPVLIARYLKGFMDRIGNENLTKTAYFAIHPGGPKILQHVQEILGLSDTQMQFSYQILRERGNMSSATLPHIWKELLEHIPEKSLVVSIAFGPGLTICGNILEKRCSGPQ